MRGELPRLVRVFTPADLTSTDPTPGMNRALAFELPLLWAGQVVTEPGAVSGWHHHERNESSLYIVRGVLRLECEGHDGYLDAGPATSCTCRPGPFTASRTPPVSHPWRLSPGLVAASRPSTSTLRRIADAKQHPGLQCARLERFAAF